jgi:hypothetical protein
MGVPVMNSPTGRNDRQPSMQNFPGTPAARMTNTLYLHNGVLTEAGFDYIQETLPKMDEAGYESLTTILDRMSHGDPWQEGVYALEIVQAWESW